MKMYFVAVVLPERINEKVLVYKQLMREKYGCRVGLKSPAHITLVPPFWMQEDAEALLTAELGKLAPFSSFTLSTNNFDAFKPRTIFIALQPSGPLEDLKKMTDEIFRDQPHLRIKTDTRPFHPHITIATRDLHKKSFAEAWPVFAGKTFLETWMAEGISLLKHNGLAWDVIFTHPFRKAE